MPTYLRRLRQVALMCRDLEESREFWTGAFGLEECYRDDLSAFGLSNVLMPIGDTFLELLQVEDKGSAGARFLERHGEGLYMTIFEGVDIPGLERTLEENQVQVAYRIEREGYRGIHIHPKAMNRVLVSVDDPMGPDRWPAAGDDWRSHIRTDVVTTMIGVGFITEDADADGERWQRLFNVTPERSWVQDGLRIDNVPIGDGGTFVEFQQPVAADAPAARFLARHGPGMYYWALGTRDLDAALTRVRQHGVEVIRVDEGAGGGRSAWLHPRTTHGVLTELIERG